MHTSRGLVGHAKHGEGVGALDVEDIAIMGKGSVAVFVVNISGFIHHLVEYLSGHGVGIGGS